MVMEEAGQQLGHDADWAATGPNNMPDVSARQVNNIMNLLDKSRRITDSEFDDLLTAFETLADLLWSMNTTEEMRRAYTSYWEMDERPPKVDANAYSGEKGKKIQAQMNLITSTLSRYYDVTAWLLKLSRETNTMQDMNFNSIADPRPAGSVQVDNRGQGFMSKLWDTFSIKRPEKKRAEKALGILESKFQEIENVKQAWMRWVNQHLYKFSTIYNENDPIAMAPYINADIRGLRHVQTLILSTLTLSYRLDLERSMLRLAQAAQHMTTANAGATALGAATTAAAMSQMQGQRPGGP